MSQETNVAVVRRFYEDLCNQRRLDLADELMTEDHVYHDPQVPGVQGPAAMAQALAAFQRGLEGQWQLEEALACGEDRVIVRWTGTGRHTGELMGIPPTGRTVRCAAIALLRLREGKIAEHWCVWDTLGLLQQLGVAPTMQQAPV